MRAYLEVRLVHLWHDGAGNAVEALVAARRAVAREHPKPTAIAWGGLATALEFGPGGGVVGSGDSDGVEETKREAIEARRRAVQALDGRRGWVTATFNLGTCSLITDIWHTHTHSHTHTHKHTHTRYVFTNH